MYVATAILLMLLVDGRVRKVGEQGSVGFQMSLVGGAYEHPKCVYALFHAIVKMNKKEYGDAGWFVSIPCVAIW